MVSKCLNCGRLIKRILLHLLFWFLFLSILAWGFGAQSDPIKAFTNISKFLPGFLLIVYSLLYFLVPRYLLKRKFLPFFIGLVVLIGLCMLYTALTQVSLGGSNVFRGMRITRGGNILPYLNAAGTALSVKLLLHWYEQKKQTIEAERQKDEVELQLLKAQLHPEFLFNTLDNLYTYTLETSPRSPEIVMKLSELLRFMIYESNTPKIPLAREIKLLQTYSALEELRYGERLDISIKVSGDIENCQIAPFLLLPFLENAFKHGTSEELDQCWISLNIFVENSVMYFKLVNSIEPDHEVELKIVEGSGLLKVRRRLDLLYKDNYSFETKRLEEAFVASLEVTLEELEDQFREMQILSSASTSGALS